MRCCTNPRSSTSNTRPVVVYCSRDWCDVRELKQGRRRRRRRGRRLVKNEFIFYKLNSRMFNSFQYANCCKSLLGLNIQRQRIRTNGNAKNQPSSSTLRRRRRTLKSFHVVVLQKTAKKCTESYNARAQLLFVH